MRWFKADREWEATNARIDSYIKATQDLIAKVKELEREQWKDEFKQLQREKEVEERRDRIADSAARIAGQLYCTYRLAAIITNAPDPAEKLDDLNALLDEALEVATKIEDGLAGRTA